MGKYNIPKQAQNFQKGFFALNTKGKIFRNHEKMKKYIKEKEKIGYECLTVNLMDKQYMRWRIILVKN